MADRVTWILSFKESKERTFNVHTKTCVSQRPSIIMYGEHKQQMEIHPRVRNQYKWYNNINIEG